MKQFFSLQEINVVKSLEKFFFFKNRQHVFHCLHSYRVDFSLRGTDVFPVVASLPPKIAIFRRERSEGGFPLSRNFSVRKKRLNKIETMNVNEWKVTHT